MWRLIPLSENNPYYNMAVDEAVLLSHSQKKTPPTLRFYIWNPPSISLGYFQKESVCQKQEWEKLNIPFVRRLSGGRAVYHLNDLTYSFIIREDYNLLPKNISESCRVIGDCLYRGLISFGLPDKYLEINFKKAKSETGNLKSKDKRQKTDNCFNIFSHSEILYNGKKLVGSAQVRKWSGILQHGSILVNQLPVWGVTPRQDNENSLNRTMITLNEILRRDVKFDEITPFIISGFENIFNAKFITGNLTEEEKNTAKELEKKYRDVSN